MQTWSRDLEAFAAEYATLNTINHSSTAQRCNIAGGVGRYAGENTYSAGWGLWNNTNPADQEVFYNWAVVGWCNEGDRYNYDTGTFEGASPPGHFTQVPNCPAPRSTPSTPC